MLVVAFVLLVIGLSFVLKWLFASGITIYLLGSKAYSWDRIRLKNYPITSTVVVTIFQGAFTFLLIEVGLTDKIEFELTRNPHAFDSSRVSICVSGVGYPSILARL